MVKKRSVIIRIQAPGLIERADRAAAALCCDPRQLCLALLIKTFEGDLVAAILDEESPTAIAPRYGRKLPRDQRGPRQQAVFDWAVRKAGTAGSFVCSFKAAGRELGLPCGDVSGVVRSLIRRGDLIVVRAAHRSPSVWTIPQHLIGEGGA